MLFSLSYTLSILSLKLASVFLVCACIDDHFTSLLSRQEEEVCASCMWGKHARNLAMFVSIAVSFKPSADSSSGEMHRGTNRHPAAWPLCPHAHGSPRAFSFFLFTPSRPGSAHTKTHSNIQGLIARSISSLSVLSLVEVEIKDPKRVIYFCTQNRILNVEINETFA